MIYNIIYNSQRLEINYPATVEYIYKLWSNHIMECLYHNKNEQNTVTHNTTESHKWNKYFTQKTQLIMQII